MNGKELRKLSRKQLLEILLAQVTRIEELEKEIEKKNKELESKKVTIKESGSIADASLKLSGIFEVADQACKDYTNNIIENGKKLEKETIKECKALKKKMLDEAKEKCSKLEEKTNKKLEALKLEIEELEAIKKSIKLEKPVKSSSKKKKKMKKKGK